MITISGSYLEWSILAAIYVAGIVQMYKWCRAAGEFACRKVMESRYGK